MAYPTIDAPYGLVPVGLIGGRNYAGGVREMKIANNYGTAIGNGDLVTRVADGTIARDGSTTAFAATGTLGVFVGCSYTDPNTGQLTFNNQYPGSIAADDIVAKVVDDPDVTFKVAVVSGTTTIASVGRTVVGNNVALVSNTLTTANGRSKVAVLSTSANTTKTLPLKVLDVVEETKTGSDAFVELIVTYNPAHEASNVTTGGHSYRNPTGL